MSADFNMDNVLEQLGHKRRTVKDLAQFLENKCDETPNYTFLLGSGCSVTSGVNTGQKLIEEWKQSIYDAEHDVDETEEHFWEHQYSWFDERNPYSSLFEKKYDLPRQRRIFVEREIAGKTPSIGYAYLVKIIERHFVNTVFTTNFDDLLNEAFYRYSKDRPIVCAHDSSISSITVTSKRPKIIKLHGDYLFDDIKSTLRETESLNDNMKNKFIEFAKDHGLIVVGYAGNDRSIMDILNMLLQKEDYFKYGIYWCIRKGDKSISEELRKLLWKDRVYFVEIEGFDELMASLNNTLNKGELPVDDDLLSSRRQKKLITDMISSKYFDDKTSTNAIITRDIKKLRLIVKRHIIDDVFDVLKSSTPNNENPRKKNNLEMMTDEERKKIDYFHHLMMDDNYQKALEEIEKENVEVSKKSTFNFNLLSMKADIYGKNDDEESVVKIKEIFQQLVSLNPSREETYIDAYHKLVDSEFALSFVDAAIKQFPNDYTLYNLKAKYIYVSQIDGVNDTNSEIFVELKRCIDKSLELFDSPTNEAWVNLCRYFSLFYFGENERKCKKIKETFEKYSNLMTSNLPCAYQFFYKEIGIEAKDCIVKLKELLDYADKADDWSFYEEVISALLNVYEEQDDKNAIQKLLIDYESKYEPSDSFLFLKARCFQNTLGKYKEAKELIQKNLYKSRRWKDLLLRYYCDVRDKNNAGKILNKYFKNDPKKQLTFYSSFNDDEKVICIVDQYAQNHELDLTFISAKSCSLIRLKKYEEAYNFTKKYYDQPFMQREGVVCINYFLAYKNYKKPNDLDNKIHKKMIDGFMHYSEAEMAAAYALLNDKAKCFSCLRKVIEKHELMKFDVKEWPVFANYYKDNDFIKMTDKTSLDL